MSTLRAKQAQLQEVQNQIKILQDQFESSVAEKEGLGEDAGPGDQGGIVGTSGD